MSEPVAALERLIAKLPPGRAKQRYEAILAQADQTSPDPTPPPQSPEALKEAMWQSLLSHNRWMARVYQELPPQARQEVLSKLQAVEEAIDQSCREGNWAAFQEALAKAKVIVTEARGQSLPIVAQHTQLNFELIKEVFPEAQIIGQDDTDWEAHSRRIKAWEEARKLGCWNCGGLRFWTWPGGAKRCARCHPPAEPERVVWLDE